MPRSQTPSSSRRKARTTRDPRKLVAVPSAEQADRAAESGHPAAEQAARPRNGDGGGSEPADRDTGEANKSSKARTSDAPAAPAAPALDDPRMSDVDEWGRSEHLRELLRKIYDPIYDHWFRVEWEGFDKIPTEGGALMVANHAGAIPVDAPSIMHGIERELGRPVYGLADQIFKRVPVVNLGWSRLGGVQAHPDNAYRLLREQHQLVMVFPEGTKGPGKTYAERYQLRRFGRGGFVQIAMRSGVPIIPMAVVGSEETMPTLFTLPMLARALRVPYFPVTANMLLFGPLGLVVPFPAKIRIRVLDPVRFDVPPDQPRYSRSRVMDASEQIRQTIQDAVHDMLRTRRGVWSG
ncbi:MAG TPA: lysophospholipid acyltransferase family protein [Acidimicrobiales bacterium]|nr:lysophospholipid acyltransferase family protein [Acidimicrobiales bacterium]